MEVLGTLALLLADALESVLALWPWRRVPDVTGTGADRAVELLAASSLAVAFTDADGRAVEVSAAAGTVAAQRPAPGARVRRRSTVAVTVATAAVVTAVVTAEGREPGIGEGR